MHLARIKPRRLSLLVALVATAPFTACSSGSTTPLPNAVASIEIRAGALPVEPGSSRQLHAVVRARDGRELHGYPVAWSAANDAVAFVDATTGGLVAREGGETEISATSGGVSARTTIQVRPWLNHALVAAADQALPARLHVGLYVDDDGLVRNTELLSIEGTLRVSPSHAFYEQRLVLHHFEDGRLASIARVNDRGVITQQGESFTFTSAVLQGVTFTGTRAGDSWEITQAPVGTEGPATSFRFSAAAGS